MSRSRAGAPTSRAPVSSMPTTEGVSRLPNAFGMSFGLPSMSVPMRLLVVPRSIPTSILVLFLGRARFADGDVDVADVDVAGGFHIPLVSPVAARFDETREDLAVVAQHLELGAFGGGHIGGETQRPDGHALLRLFVEAQPAASA